MDLMQAKLDVIKAGKLLCERGLIQRTWGNVSCRIDENTFVITPSNVDVSGEQMRTAAGEDTSNYTTTFGVAAEAQGNSETLFD